MTEQRTNGKLQAGDLNNPEKNEKNHKYILLNHAGSEEDNALERDFNKAMKSYPVKPEDEIVQQVKCCNDLFPIKAKDVDNPFFCPKCGKEYPALPIIRTGGAR